MSNQTDVKYHPTSMRLTPRSLEQLKFLQKCFGENKTITLTRIITEAYINEIRNKDKKK